MMNNSKNTSYNLITNKQLTAPVVPLKINYNNIILTNDNYSHLSREDYISQPQCDKEEVPPNVNRHLKPSIEFREGIIEESY